MHEAMRRLNIDSLESLSELQHEQVATIGFFDGVHRGHQYLVRRVVEEATHTGYQSMVITFDRHPRQLAQGDYHPLMLTTLDQKLEKIAALGVDYVAVLRFDQDMARLTAKEFMSRVLCRRLKVRKLILGYDNRFGHDRREGFDDYVRYGHELGMDVTREQVVSADDSQSVSSSLIRACIQEGDIVRAHAYLGYPYTITGVVVPGYQEGRKLGFPTANLDTSDFGQLIPLAGAYAVEVKVENSSQRYWGMMNIGTRPTFHGHSQTLEVHLFDFDGDLYGKVLQVSFRYRIRGEKHFSSVEELSLQLQKDKLTCQSLLGRSI